MMQIQFDKEADALYITLGEDDQKKGLVKRSERMQGNPIVLDYDEEGKLFGIEVFDLSACARTGFFEDFSLQYAGQSICRKETV